MWLKFVGADGSMGLAHGEKYNVKIKTDDKYIWVIIPNFELRHMVFSKWKCLYSSPQSFAANWELGT